MALFSGFDKGEDFSSPFLEIFYSILPAHSGIV